MAKTSHGPQPRSPSWVLSTKRIHYTTGQSIACFASHGQGKYKNMTGKKLFEMQIGRCIPFFTHLGNKVS